MSAYLNKVFLIGRLTRDPVKRSTPAGTSVAEMGLAVNRRYRTAEGEAREETCFVDLTAWGRTADICSDCLRKGSLIFVEGRLKLDQWEKNGEKRSKLSVIAETVQFLDPASRQGRDEIGDAPEEDVPPVRGGIAKSSAEKPAAASRGPKGDSDDPENDDDSLPF
ncbi:MAG: single-stranded DNA-binding protein [Kiritimatiellae bacterium]|nr:single-stranded DNA-binding protein [Kiritimatiellia bacterium]MDW8457635.1 single-stranded DNA-binding protein [Verrucomicrobiota bacterium]